MAEKEETLLSVLLDCFEKLGITYVEETEDGKNYLKVITNAIDSRWAIVFCKDIVALSVAPNSPNKERLSRVVLNALRRGNVSDQTKSVITKQYIPTFKSSVANTFIEAQKEHIISVLETAVRASKSSWTKDSNDDEYLPKEKLNARENVRPFIYSTFSILKELFEEKPFEIITRDNEWFIDIVANRLPEINSDDAEYLFAEVMAAAMVLGLNIREKGVIPKADNDKVDNTIKKYLLLHFKDNADDTEPGRNKEQRKNNPDGRRNVEQNVYRNSAQKNLGNQSDRARKLISSQEAATIIETKMEEFKQSDEEDATESVRTIMHYMNRLEADDYSDVLFFFEEYRAELQRVGREDSFKYLLCLIVRVRSDIRYYERRISELNEALISNRYADLREKVLQTIKDYEYRKFSAELEFDDLNQQVHERGSIILF